MIEGQPSIYQILEAEGKELCKTIETLSADLIKASQTINLQSELLRGSTQAIMGLVEFIKKNGLVPPEEVVEVMTAPGAEFPS